MEIPNHFQNVRLDEFIIMPNHIHGIIVIDEVEREISANVETRQCLISTVEADENIGKNRFQNQGKNTISAIIGSFKSICTKTINKNFKIKNKDHKINFAWQPRFYDRIIRNEKELLNIRNYIIYNFQKWEEDENFK